MNAAQRKREGKRSEINLLVVFRFIGVHWTGGVASMLVHNQMVFAAGTVVGTVLTGSAISLARNTCFIFVI